MIFLEPTTDEIVRYGSDIGYLLIYVSETRAWFIGMKPVMFGQRVVVWRKDSYGPCVDYCAGSDHVFALELMWVIRRIFEYLPETITEREVIKLMPIWRTRPIKTDPSWPALQNLLRQLAALRSLRD